MDYRRAFTGVVNCTRPAPPVLKLFRTELVLLNFACDKATVENV